MESSLVGGCRIEMVITRSVNWTTVSISTWKFLQPTW
jgi:hypothetical protein